MAVMQLQAGNHQSPPQSPIPSGEPVPQGGLLQTLVVGSTYHQFLKQQQ